MLNQLIFWILNIRNFLFVPTKSLISTNFKDKLNNKKVKNTFIFNLTNWKYPLSKGTLWNLWTPGNKERNTHKSLCPQYQQYATWYVLKNRNEANPNLEEISWDFTTSTSLGCIFTLDLYVIPTILDLRSTCTYSDPRFKFMVQGNKW